MNGTIVIGEQVVFQGDVEVRPAAPWEAAFTLDKPLAPGEMTLNLEDGRSGQMTMVSNTPTAAGFRILCQGLGAL